MGTIIARKRRDGSTGYRAQIVIKRKGTIIHRETETFDRQQAARAWVTQREAKLAKPGALEALNVQDPTLAEVIDEYVATSDRKMSRTKVQVLRTIKTYPIAQLKCSKIGSQEVVAFVETLPVKPQTRQNYLSHLSAVFAVARPAWGYPLDYQAVRDAYTVTNRMGTTAKSDKRTRRPTFDELDKLMEHFGKVLRWSPDSTPMRKITVFALFSTRRQGEITRIEWRDYEKATENHPTARVLVRNMKHPGDKQGNDVWCDLPPEAAAIIDSMPRTAERIFPVTENAIKSAWGRACKMLQIVDLRFHDLRHEGVSRLFEIGSTIPLAASVSGHRSWHSLQRYSQIRQTGDKYKDWKWKEPSLL